jgi:FlaA1/EpsC-like NDP-sugar epimerase
VAAFLFAVALVLLGALLTVLTTSESVYAMPVGIATAVAFVLAFLFNIRSVRTRVPFARTKEDRDDILREAIAGRLAAGEQLAGELAGVTTDLAVIEDIRHRTEIWATEVRDLLDRERQGWSAVFLADVITPQYMSQYGERDTVRNWLEQRRRALRDLLVRLG